MEFQPFLDHLADAARSRADVVGLALFGSTADRARADEWSDHDFAWITEPGAEDAYRRSREWLPYSDRIMMHIVEHHGGVKVVYDDGHLAEFGVTDLAGLATWEMNRAVAAVDTGGLADVLERGAATPVRRHEPTDELALAIAAILVGAGRARRGEVLSAGSSIRGAAVAHLLHALGARRPDAYPPLDRLDPHRRAERVHPEIAADVAAAIAQPIEEAGRALLAIIERMAGDEARLLAPAAAVRRRLGWSVITT